MIIFLKSIDLKSFHSVWIIIKSAFSKHVDNDFAYWTFLYFLNSILSISAVAVDTLSLFTQILPLKVEFSDPTLLKFYVCPFFMS